MGTNNGSDKALKAKSYGFALKAAQLYAHLTTTKNEGSLADLLLNKSTAIGVNVMKTGAEATAAGDVPNLEMALREAVAAESGICICREKRLIPRNQADSLIRDCREIQAIIAGSIRSVRPVR